jgi:hypothetical protein
MSRISSAAWAVTRIAARGAGNSRLLHAGYTAAQNAGRTFVRIGHLLWLQITGLFFIVFALGFIGRMPRAYGNYLAGRESAGHFGLLVVLTILFVWFGVTSFWRAHRRQRQFKSHSS